MPNRIMVNKKFKVIEEGRLSNQMLSKLKGGEDIAAFGKCSAQEIYLSCSCSKHCDPGKPTYGTCAILCSAEFAIFPCKDVHNCTNNMYKFCLDGTYKSTSPYIG